MGYVYYPSCKFTEFSPKASELLVRYMHERYGARIAGCCRPGHKDLCAGDIAVTVCNTCQAIVMEDSPAQSKSVWELIAQDDAFPLPDLHGTRMALQDCWRSRGCTSQQDAVRAVLVRMHVEIVELPDARDASRFCGTTLLASQPQENIELVPRRFGMAPAGLFAPHTPEEQRSAMREHCAGIETDAVVCYCVPCTKGIRLGGKHGIHLAELVFGLDG